MVAAGAASVAGASARFAKNSTSPSPRRRAETPTTATCGAGGAAVNRPPLFPSENSNAVVPKRPRAKEVTSRYLLSTKGGDFTPSSTSTSSSSSNSNGGGAAVSSTSSSSSTSRYSLRSASPRPSTPPTLPQNSKQQRSKSVGRARPIANSTTTRSVAVSFQGEAFSYQTSKARPLSPSPNRRSTPERQRVAARPSRSAVRSFENPKPLDNHHHRWPAARSQNWANPLSRSFDCSTDRKDSILSSVQSLRQSMVFSEDQGRVSFDGGDLLVSSDTDSLTSGSNSWSYDTGILLSRGPMVTPRRSEVTPSMHRFLENDTPLPSSSSMNLVYSKVVSAKKSLMNGLSSSPSVSVRACSPSRPIATTPLRKMASPQRVRNSPMTSSPANVTPTSSPSIVSLVSEVRRGRNGEIRIDSAHQLRLLHNWQMQWRWINALLDDTLFARKMIMEKCLYNSWTTTAAVHESVAAKKIKLQVHKHNLNLSSIINGQMSFLEEWSLLDRVHTSSLLGAFDALKASSIRLPVVDGAKADLHEVKNAVGSALDVMQAIGMSVCSVLFKVEGRNYMLFELAELATREQELMHQCRDLLSTAAAMNVKQCSLLAHLTQLRSNMSQIVQ